MTDIAVLRVTVTARQRLALGVGSEVAFFTATHPFVPGSVLRGALAAAWIAEHGPPGAGAHSAARFRDLFDGDIRYGPLHVPGASLVPVSAWLCKYPKDGDCEAQAVDAAFEAGRECPACGGPLDQGKGQMLPGTGTLARVTRTSIDPATAKAKDGELYAHAALPAGTELGGVIHGRDSWLEQPRVLRLGGRRTVGGAAEYMAVPDSARAPAQSWNGSGALVVRLSSPGVFVDPAGRPRLSPDPGLDLDGATIERSWARPVIWAGWHAASSLPKPEELCAAAGSIYRLTGPSEVLRRLAERLPRDGAGLRRTEGFGDVQLVCEPWRPPAKPATQPTTSADTRATELRDEIVELELTDEQHRWVIAALRDLRLAHERATADPAAAQRVADLANVLLARPAADSFSGRQRDRLRTLFAETDPRLLRDLTTLLTDPAARTGRA